MCHDISSTGKRIDYLGRFFVFIGGAITGPSFEMLKIDCME
jgi:hypothetical protein